MVDAKAAIIDPGMAKGAEIILEGIDRDWNVEYICPTHVHLDHGGGAAKLAKTLDAKIFVHPKGVKHVVNPERLWEASKAVLGEVADIYGKPESVEEDGVVAVEDGEEFELGEEILKVFFTLRDMLHTCWFITLPIREYCFPQMPWDVL